MNVSLKRTCVGCRAYKYGSTNFGACALRYSTVMVPHRVSKTHSFMNPREPCPKPITLTDLEMALAWRKSVTYRNLGDGI